MRNTGRGIVCYVSGVEEKYWDLINKPELIRTSTPADLFALANLKASEGLLWEEK